ncbi:aromatic amino acid transaminase [Allosphingosinicella indica]|uniref:Aromatic-amino-acid transaminase n=1 Tax=Allosphingosinicella indica TaxID=941907 RepID=A0A1X7GHC0_9SPHN|nr:aromatic amino acid transaminase [Allosphingosinicella indica]SMF69676.1 aromatic-amino-acid transaminase [Allosphingosinicella indica]
MFQTIPDPVPDALHGVMAAFRADPRPHKIDLGVGVYRDDSGASPVMAAVKAAEARLVADQDSKAYQALKGDEAFVAGLGALALGVPLPPRAAAIQGSGGTGCLRLALELAKAANPEVRLHLGLPSWPNHANLAAATGIALVTHRYFDVEAQRIDREAVRAAAEGTRAGDLFLFHGLCHNPTGSDLDDSDRAGLLAILRENGAVPLVDVAYYGLGDGLEADLAFVRTVAAEPRALISVACSKAFGLYRERTGLLIAVAESEAEAARVQGRLETISRTLVSMPPAHGAAVVVDILVDSALRKDWMVELEEMRARIFGLRGELEALSNVAPMLAGISRQRGIFRMLPLSPDQIAALARDHAIHMAPSGRINIAGLKAGDAARLAEALAALSKPGASL